MSFKSLLILVPCALFSICLFAQKKKKGEMPNRIVCNYGDVKPEDFMPTVYPIDSAADAVYLFDGGKTDFEGSHQSEFEAVHQVHRRIRLLKKNAFALATIEIPLYVTSDFQEKVQDIKATTYTLSGGAVTTQSLSKSDIFQEKEDDHHQLVKFTLPNLSEGCIIEYSYTDRIPYGQVNIPGWLFQKNYPVLWSEYEVNYPLIFDYFIVKQGYHPYAIDTTTFSRGSFNLTEKRDVMYGGEQELSMSVNVAHRIWAMKDVPTLKREPFTTTLNNHVAKIEFQLSAIRYSDNDIKHYMQSWAGTADTLLHDDFYYGNAFNDAYPYLNSDVQTAVAGASTTLDRAKKIYEFVRDNYTCTETYPWMQQSLRKVYVSKKGNSAEINLLLTAMLTSAGFWVNPVLLSTADHGKAYKDYPILDKYNHTICQLQLNGQSYLLDASNSKLGFNKLDAACYNGYARVINQNDPRPLNLLSDSLKEWGMTSVFIVNGKAAGQLLGSVSSMQGYQESLKLRESLSKRSEADFFKSIKTGYTGDVTVDNTNIDSLSQYDMPVKIRYDLTMNLNQDDDLLYFNPILYGQEKENSFTAAERYYPVEMPYCTDKAYVLDMEIPEGYTVDELPKNTRVMLNENQGMFEYLIAKSGNHIQMRTRLKLEKAVYEPDDYQTLREFYTYVVKKEAEQIVFKKIK